MIGKRLKELREQRQLSQRQLARLLHTSDKSIKNWESDISDPNLKSFCALLNMFHVSADDLLGRTHTETVDLSCLPEREKRVAKRLFQVMLDEAESN